MELNFQEIKDGLFLKLEEINIDTLYVNPNAKQEILVDYSESENVEEVKGYLLENLAILKARLHGIGEEHLKHLKELEKEIKELQSVVSDSGELARRMEFASRRNRGNKYMSARELKDKKDRFAALKDQRDEIINSFNKAGESNLEVEKEIKAIKDIFERFFYKRIEIFPKKEAFDNEMNVLYEDTLFCIKAVQYIQVGYFDSEDDRKWDIEESLSKMEFPEAWRRLIYEILSGSLALEGFLLLESERHRPKLNRRPWKLSHYDHSILLLLKSAIGKNSSIKAENKLFLALNKGLIAVFRFRKKNESVINYQEKTIEIYAKSGGMNRRSRLFFSNENLEVEVPYGYYILSSHYVIDISFVRSETLFNQSNMEDKYLG